MSKEPEYLLYDFTIDFNELTCLHRYRRFIFLDYFINKLNVNEDNTKSYIYHLRKLSNLKEPVWVDEPTFKSLTPSIFGYKRIEQIDYFFLLTPEVYMLSKCLKYEMVLTASDGSLGYKQAVANGGGIDVMSVVPYKVVDSLYVCTEFDVVLCDIWSYVAMILVKSPRIALSDGYLYVSLSFYGVMLFRVVDETLFAKVMMVLRG